MQNGLTSPIIVPQYGFNAVRYFVPDAATGAKEDPTFFIDLKQVAIRLGLANLKPNSCVLSADSLFVSFNGGNQGIIKFPGYLSNPTQSIQDAFIYTRLDDDYVGMAIEHSHFLYAAQGKKNPANNTVEGNEIFRYSEPASGNPPPAGTGPTLQSSSLSGLKYFANLAFDSAGNLWASDAKNNRLIVFEGPTLGFADPVWHVLSNLTGIGTANSNKDENNKGFPGTIEAMFSEPEGMDFDSAGNLWVANNNAGPLTTYTALVRISPTVQAKVLATPPRTAYAVEPALLPECAVFQIRDYLQNHSQLGGLQIDRNANRLFVNEQWYAQNPETANPGHARWFDLATIGDLENTDEAASASIMSNILCPYPGNGGLAIVRRNLFDIHHSLGSTNFKVHFDR